MRLDTQLAQQSSAQTTERAIRSMGACCHLTIGTGAGLENPLGILADRSVETRQERVLDFPHASSDTSAQGNRREKLAKGAQENGLQQPLRQRCVSSLTHEASRREGR